MSDGGLRGTLQVPFGLKDGRLFEPMQVSSGLQCGCVCPGCGATLVARHSPSGKVTPNFAHASDAACSTGLETALHLAAKQLISERRKLYLPELRAEVGKVGVSGRSCKRKAVLRRAGLASMQDVRLEEKVGAIRPDLVVEVEGEDLVLQVEIANTHFISREKLILIARQGVATLEVDVSDLINLNFETLSKRLFEASERAKWVFHPKVAAQNEELWMLLAVDLEEDRQQWEQYQAQGDQVERSRRERDADLRRRQVSAERIRANRSAAALAKTRATPHEQLLTDALAYLSVSGVEMRQFLPVSTRGSSSIKARPFVWQVLAFAALIHPALKRRTPTIGAAKVLAWLSARFDVDQSHNSASVATWDFLEGLEERGLLHRQRRQEFLVVVPDIAGALQVIADAKSNCVQDLRWGDDWPSQEKASVVATAFAVIYGYAYCWNRLAGLLPEVAQRESPSETMAYYQRPANGGMAAKALRRYFLVTGLAKLHLEGLA